MKKILFVVENFAPNNSIGAIRPTKFAKYLSRKGYIVDVVTRQEFDYGFDRFLDSDCKSINSIIRIKSGGRIVRFITNYKDELVKKRKKEKISRVSEKGQTKSRKEKLIKKKIRLYINFLKDWGFVWQFRKEKLDLSGYEYLYTTYGRYSNHIIGRDIKKKYPNVKWIVDFRDPVLVENMPALETFSKNFIRNYCNNADGLIAVSEGVIENLFLKEFGGIIEVITNGYDKEDYDNKIQINRNSKLKITYAGQMYERRDFSVFFKAIRELNLCEHIQFLFMGKGYEQLCSYANKYDLTGILSNLGFVSRDKAIDVMSKSDMLIMSSWNTKKEKGVLTGKLLEYMMLNKPVIGIVSGDVKGSSVKKVINDCRIGFAYEEANHEIDYENLKVYLMEQFNSHTENGKLNFEPNTKEIEKYSYSNLTNQLISLFESL